MVNSILNLGCEGLIVKALFKNSSYQPGQRNFNWLKLKKDYLETSVGDSLDLVPIGAAYGKGKRVGTYGSFLLACYNDENECYETLTMTGAGLKDEHLKKFYEVLKEHLLEAPRNDYKIAGIELDVWFEPKLVWEIKTADLSLSPIYTAGIDEGEEKRGISLRFPRFIRERPDKQPHECTTSKEVYQMYINQAFNNKNKKEIDFQGEEEFYD
jgi:DNA ligase-1